MKYIVSFLILIGGMAGLIGIVFFVSFAGDKIKEWEWNLDRKYKKYHDIKNKFIPWVFAIFMLCVLLASLTAMYLEILKRI